MYYGLHGSRRGYEQEDVTMPGEEMITEAAKSWAGPEAVVFGIVSVVLVITAIGLWRHLTDCKRATERLHERISQEGKSRREEIRQLEAKVDDLIPIVHRIDERTKESK